MRLPQEEMVSLFSATQRISRGSIDGGYVWTVAMGSVCTFARKGKERGDSINPSCQVGGRACIQPDSAGPTDNHSWLYR